MSTEQARELAALCGGEHWPHAGRTFRRGFRRGLRRRQADGKEMAGSSAHALLEAAAPALKDRKLFREVLTRLSLIFRDALVLRMGGAAMLGGAPEEAQALCALPKRRLAALPGLAEEFKQRRTAMQIWLAGNGFLRQAEGSCRRSMTACVAAHDAENCCVPPLR